MHKKNTKCIKKSPKIIPLRSQGTDVRNLFCTPPQLQVLIGLYLPSSSQRGNEFDEQVVIRF